jgi:glucokinase
VIVSAMDVGGTHVAAANVDVVNRSIVSGQTCRVALDCAADAEHIVAALAGCAARLPPSDGRRWAIALPGPFDYERGVGRYVGMGKFDALCGYDLRAALSPLLPGSGHVSFHNDAEAFLLGEWWAGAARGHHNAVGITLGTGVGSCFLRDGRVLRQGPGIPPDGRVDLLRYAGKPLEETVSRNAIRRAYGQSTGVPPTLDVREIAERARQADPAAADVFARTFYALGTVLGPGLAAFDPTILVVGGSIAASWDLVAGPLRAGLGNTVPALEPARHPAAAPLLGAACLAVRPSRTSRSATAGQRTTG